VPFVVITRKIHLLPGHLTSDLEINGFETGFVGLVIAANVFVLFRKSCGYCALFGKNVFRISLHSLLDMDFSIKEETLVLIFISNFSLELETDLAGLFFIGTLFWPLLVLDLRMNLDNLKKELLLQFFLRCQYSSANSSRCSHFNFFVFFCQVVVKLYFRSNKRDSR